MHRLAESLIWMLVTAFRFVAIAVAIMLFVFPAYKGVWAGYLPLLLAAILLRGGEGFYNLIQSGLQSFSEARYYVLLLILSVGIQFALILIFRPEPASDGFFVYREACRLLETGGMDPLTYYAPAQIWYYALFFCKSDDGRTPSFFHLLEFPDRLFRCLAQEFRVLPGDLFRHKCYF